MPAMASDKKKSIPAFASESAEAESWDSVDSTDYVDWSTAENVRLPHLKPSTRTISLTLPEMMLADLRVLANRRGVPYQSLLEIFLAERLGLERRGGS